MKRADVYCTLRVKLGQINEEPNKPITPSQLAQRATNILSAQLQGCSVEIICSKDVRVITEEEVYIGDGEQTDGFYINFPEGASGWKSATE